MTIMLCGNCLDEFENKVPFDHECELKKIQKRQELEEHEASSSIIFLFLNS